MLELVLITSPECSPVVSNESPVLFALSPSLTVKVPPSTITPSSSCAVVGSFTPKTVIVSVAVAVPLYAKS